jgi:RimM protein, required for 16S rRNA processing
LITLEGISDRTQAEAFVDTDIYIERKALPDLDSDTYYWFEILNETQKSTALTIPVVFRFNIV